MDFEKVIQQRRSIRRFTDKPVSLELIKKLIADATYAPTNCNQQLWKFVVVTDQHLKERLVREAKSNTNVRRAPVVIVGCYDAWDYKEAIQGASMATQHVLLSATNNGVGAYPMNSFGNEKKVKNILKIPDSYVINCFILVGYPTDVYRSTPLVKKRPVDEVMDMNKFKKLFPSHRSYNSNKWSKEMLIDYQKYYCRKTFLGKEMDIMDELERAVVRKSLEKNTDIADFFSYDGGMLPLLPNTSITSVNLDEETEAYVKAAKEMYCREKELTFQLYDKLQGSFDTVSMAYKVERLPPKLREDAWKKALSALEKDGELVVVARRPSLLFKLFYYAIIKLFGDDIRKTGIYAFWGPYKPVKQKVIMGELEKVGFKEVKAKKYFFWPPFFNQALQMLIQYIKSGGTSYLHREKHKNVFTRIFDVLITKQKMKPNMFGSVMVIRGKK